MQDRLDCVGTHLQAHFLSFSRSAIVGMTIYINVHACTVSMATPMQTGRLFHESFFVKSFLPIRENFLPRQFLAMWHLTEQRMIP